MASSSSLLSLPSNWKHHVFPSFHGADVRKSFLSHLLKEFRSKAIDPFIDNNIDRSKSIGPELIKAINGSRIAIILLSMNYASSTWCLDELVEIIKCREKFGQTVMTLFYEVDPTDIKKQTGKFGKVFTQTCERKTDDDIRRWKQALAKVTTIAGYHSRNWENEAKMIERIAVDVSNKLKFSTASSDFECVVGMESHLIMMGSMLRLNSKKVRIIGIWGPPGIGKTTIARFLFHQHSEKFQLSVFMENIRASYTISACSDNYSVKKYFQEQFMSQLISEEGFKIPHLGIVKDRLKDKKVLVVLDDVNQLVQLEAMANQISWFGPWSRIIITTQDRKLLQASGVKHIYNVEFPSSHEALQMFCMYAFGQKSPKDGFMELAWEVTKLVGELPLGLRVMGSYFRGMSKPEWTDALPRLKTRLNGEVESILKFSYDALCDEDKRLYLHIACFFNHEQVNDLEVYLRNSFSDLKQGIHVLVEKSLISLHPLGTIEMHNLLVQLGREVVRKQSVNEPGRRLFLNDARDIGEVVSDDKSDSSSVIGIHLMFSDDDNDIMCTSMRAFERWSNLQFLRINGYFTNLLLPGTSYTRSRKSRLLSWMPWLPSNLYIPGNLNSIYPKLRLLSWTDFPMPYLPSNFNPKLLVKLDMRRSKLKRLWKGIQPLTNLKWMDLSESKRLKKVPDLSTATNLQELKLSHCSNLVELPSSIGKAINLKKLHLRNCSSLVKLPSIENLINLEYLDLRKCSSLVNFSSIGNAINLGYLNLANCTSLVKLPSIGNAINLKYLDLCNCSSLVKLPISIGNAINLEELDLFLCRSLVELPSSMKNLRRLSKLRLSGCSKLEVVLTNINLEYLEELDLSGCSSLKCDAETSTYTEDIKPSGTSIREVSYGETQELGPWIRRRSLLRCLKLAGMQKLVSLPHLPYSLLELDAKNCKSLEKLRYSFRNPGIRRLNFANCFKLNQEARDLIIQTRVSEFSVLPGEEVPPCFTYRAFGGSLTVKLNQKPLRTTTKFKACIIFFKDPDQIGYYSRDVNCSITSKQNPLTTCTTNCKTLNTYYPQHLYTFEVEVVELTSTELVFEFEISTQWRGQRWLAPKECGMLQLLEDTSC